MRLEQLMASVANRLLQSQVRDYKQIVASFQQQNIHPHVSFKSMSNNSQSQHFPSEDSESSQAPHNILDEFFEKAMSQHPDPDFSFYKQYCRLFLNNIQLIKQIKQAQETNRQLEGKLMAGMRHSQSHSNPEDSGEEKKKRMRRTAGEIARHYVCHYQKCQKSYGSEGSLNQHIKLKHSNNLASQ